MIATPAKLHIIMFGEWSFILPIYGYVFSCVDINFIQIGENVMKRTITILIFILCFFCHSVNVSADGEIVDGNYQVVNDGLFNAETTDANIEGIYEENINTDTFDAEDEVDVYPVWYEGSYKSLKKKNIYDKSASSKDADVNNSSISGSKPGNTVALNEYIIIPMMYHKLSEVPEDLGDFCVTPQIFENDIKYFKQNNYDFMLASELDDYVPQKGDKKVVITFDDGYKSDYQYALPILEKYSAKATFYIVGEFIDTCDYMTKEEIKRLSDSPYAEIGNHSYSLHKKAYDEIYNEVYTNRLNVINDFQKNKKLLSQITQKEITSLTYPNGLFTTKLNAILKTMGYKTIFSTGSIKYRPGDIKPTGRINRNYNYTLEELLKIELV